MRGSDKQGVICGRRAGISIYPWPMCTDMLSSISPTPPQDSRNEDMMRSVCLPQSGRHYTGILFHLNKTGIFCYTEVWVPVKRKTAQKVIGLEEVEGTMSHVPHVDAYSSVELRQCSHLCKQLTPPMLASLLEWLSSGLHLPSSLHN